MNYFYFLFSFVSNLLSLLIVIMKCMPQQMNKVALFILYFSLSFSFIRLYRLHFADFSFSNPMPREREKEKEKSSFSSFLFCALKRMCQYFHRKERAWGDIDVVHCKEMRWFCNAQKKKETKIVHVEKIKTESRIKTWNKCKRLCVVRSYRHRIAFCTCVGSNLFFIFTLNYLKCNGHQPQ